MDITYEDYIRPFAVDFLLIVRPSRYCDDENQREANSRAVIRLHTEIVRNVTLAYGCLFKYKLSYEN